MIYVAISTCKHMQICATRMYSSMKLMGLFVLGWLYRMAGVSHGICCKAAACSSSVLCENTRPEGVKEQILVRPLVVEMVIV